MITTPTRGVGINRNLALLAADADIVLFADDDLIYENDYQSLVLSEFTDNPNADIIIFNLKYIEMDGVQNKRKINRNRRKLHTFSILNYGAPRIAIRLASQRKAGIWFNTEFGGGSKYNAGEDSLFLLDALRAGLKIYTSENCIATTDLNGSSWFTGYDSKYFYDKGAFYAAAFGSFAPLLNLSYIVRHRETIKKMGSVKAFRMMMSGSRGYVNDLTYREWSERHDN